MKHFALYKSMVVLLSLLALVHSSLAQAIDYSQFSGKPINVSFSTKIPNVFFCNYFHKYKAAATLKIPEQFSYSTIESLMTSMYSAGNMTRYKACFLSGKEKTVSEQEIVRRASADTIKNHFNLLHKLQFDHGGKPTVILKYQEFKDSTWLKPASLQAQFIDGRWFVVNDPSLADMEYTFRMLKTKAFWEIKGRSNTDDPDLIFLRKQVKDDSNELNISALYSIIKEWDDKNFINKLSKFCDL